MEEGVSIAWFVSYCVQIYKLSSLKYANNIFWWGAAGKRVQNKIVWGRKFLNLNTVVWCCLILHNFCMSVQYSQNEWNKKG